MHRALDRDALEREAVAAQSLYIAAFARMERLEHVLRCGTAGVTDRDILVAESEHRRRFVALRDLLDALGYVPCGFTARLPPEPGTSARCRWARHA